MDDLHNTIFFFSRILQENGPELDKLEAYMQHHHYSIPPLKFTVI